MCEHPTIYRAQAVRAQVDPTAIIATDELPAYIAIGRQQGGHIKVNHSAGEFVRTDERTGLKAHVNTAESVHAMFKRAIIGVWHQISGKHMHRYLGEIEFRWNRRGPFESRLATLFGTKFGTVAAQGHVRVRKKHGPLRADTVAHSMNAAKESFVLDFVRDY